MQLFVLCWFLTLINVLICTAAVFVWTEKLRAKPEIVADFPVLHKTDVHSVLMNDIGNVGLVLVLRKHADALSRLDFCSNNADWILLTPICSGQRSLRAQVIRTRMSNFGT